MSVLTPWAAVAAAKVVSAGAPVRVALLGTGTVGSAVLTRLACWRGTPRGERLALVYVANSRAAIQADAGLCPHASLSLVQRSPSPIRSATALAAGDPPGGRPAARPARGFLHEVLGSVPRASELDDIAAALDRPGTRIVIDATASSAVAARHAQWLAQGIHVVTACKLGQGTSLAQWRRIRAGCLHGHTAYGDSATVGAGLPLLRSIRELQAGGDRIHAIAGVLSGSLAWLFNHYDGRRAFSGLVREARAAGYTEPDPRDDLSGEDVRRKLLILARAAGVELDIDDIEVESLVPPALAARAENEVDAALSTLDTPLRERYAAACTNGEKLRFVARLENSGAGDTRARIGLESLPFDHPLAGGAGTDNRVAIWSDRYREQPLLIQGPGAGAEVTAAALLDDALRVAYG